VDFFEFFWPIGAKALSDLRCTAKQRLFRHIRHDYAGHSICLFIQLNYETQEILDQRIAFLNLQVHHQIERKLRFRRLFAEDHREQQVVGPSEIGIRLGKLLQG
jgi:hypothetical protein